MYYLIFFLPTVKGLGLNHRVKAVLPYSFSFEGEEAWVNSRAIYQCSGIHLQLPLGSAGFTPVHLREDLEPTNQLFV